MAADTWQPTEDNRAAPPPASLALAEGLTAKKKTLALTWIAATRCYRIRLVNNTAYYHPDEWLREVDVAKLELMSDWEFTVDAPDYLALFFGLLRAASGVL